MAKKSSSTKTPSASNLKQDPAGSHPVSSIRRPTRTYGGPPPLVFALILLFPLLTLYWNSEAPKRPFSVISRRDSGEFLPLSERYQVEPKLLLVTAHPDDEILFAPTVLSLLKDEQQEKAELWAVCLSTGDFGTSSGKSEDDLGVARTGEWERSWEKLGLEDRRRSIINVPALKDNNETGWTPSAIAEHLTPFIIENEIDTILTFDNDGVSGHPQHASLPGGIKHLMSSPSFLTSFRKQLKGDRHHMPRLFTLKSFPQSQQYSVISPIIQHVKMGWGGLMAGDKYAGMNPEEIVFPTIFISDIKMNLKTWKALWQHQTQLDPRSIGMWAMSRYLWVNEWDEVSVPAA